MSGAQDSGGIYAHYNAVGEVRRTTREKIVIRAGCFRGKPRVDVRTFYEGEDGEYLPTRRGVSLPAECVGELIEALKTAAAAVT